MRRLAARQRGNHQLRYANGNRAHRRCANGRAAAAAEVK